MLNIYTNNHHTVDTDCCLNVLIVQTHIHVCVRDLFCFEMVELMYSVRCEIVGVHN